MLSLISYIYYSNLFLYLDFFTFLTAHLLYSSYITATEYKFILMIDDFGTWSFYVIAALKIRTHPEENNKFGYRAYAIKNDIMLKHSSRQENANCMQISNMIHLLIWSAER